MDYVNLNSFLKFRYFLKYKNPRYTIDLSACNPDKYKDADLDDLLNIGIQKYQNAIAKQFKSGEKHVVPLSGGLDSRGILATLLEFTEAKNIYTYTYGIPGTLNYEIAPKLAKKIGTIHRNFNLNNHHYTMDELLDISRRIDYQTIVFYLPPIHELDKIYEGFNVWSGALIDVFFLAEYPKYGKTLKEGIENFIEINTFDNNYKLSNINNKDFYKYIEYDKSVINKMSFEKNLDLHNRQLKYILPHVLISGFNYKVLFNDKDLIEFTLGLSNDMLMNQFFYKKMLLKAYPYMFSFPTTANYGLPLKTSKFKSAINFFKRKTKSFINRFVYPIFPYPYLNYLDFDKSIREKDDIREIVVQNIKELKTRNIIDWIDVEDVLEKHMNKKGNFGTELITLTSLEIHLKNGKKI